MRRVTLLLWGVPQFVTLRDLSYNLDRLFNTDEIETFKIRDLPNHPQNNKRQIALDFRSGYDAMAAQEKLEGYTYVLDNGREYTLHAKINKLEEYMCKSGESPEYKGSCWYGDNWMELAMIPNVSDGDMYRAHARLDAQLELLRKQKLVLEKEKELLFERQRLKRKYGSMISSLYEEPETPLTEPNHYDEQQIFNSETECTPPKRSRSRSRDGWLSSKRQRSRSREMRPRGSHRSRSKDSSYVLPQIEWYDKRAETRELRSQSGESSRSRAYSRERRSSSRQRGDRRYPVSRQGDQRSRSNDKATYNNDGGISMSRERGFRPRSRSTERQAQSREQWSNEHRSRSRERRSRSREGMSFRRSRSNDRVTYRRSRSRNRAHLNDAQYLSRSNWDHCGRRLRSPDRRTHQLAIMQRSTREKSPSEWSIDSLKAVGTSTNNTRPDIVNKEVFIKTEKDDSGAAKEANMKGNNTKMNKMKDQERRKIYKFNSKLRKAEKTASRVVALSEDVMILLALAVDEIMDKNKISISASNKVALIKILVGLVQERLEPIARVKKYDDNAVLKNYKKQYPMADDFKMIKKMLDEIPKLEMREPEVTVTVSTENEKQNVTDVEILDVTSGSTEQQRNINNVTPLKVTPTKSTDNAPQIKKEITEEPIIIIDIDSAEKPVPRNPQFVVVIKTLVKNMNKIIRTNKLDGQIGFADLKHVLRHVLRNMLKGQGYLPREEIIRKFREAYPMENDEQFVRKAIKDIKDGKYPSLTAHVADTPENDSPDDVVLIEKKYDVVTLTDSENDDDGEKPGDVINLDCGPTEDKLGLANHSQAKPNSSSSQAMPGSNNDHDKTGPVNSDQTKPGSANAGHGERCLTNDGQTNKEVADSGPAVADHTNTNQAKTGSDNLGQADIDTSQAKTSLDKSGQIVESSNPDQAKIGVEAAMPNLSCHIQAKTGVVNPGQVKKGFVDAGQANTDHANRSQAKTSTVNTSQALPGPENATQVMASLAGNPAQVNKGPGNHVQASKGPAHPAHTMKGRGNLGHPKTASVYATQVKTGLANASQVKTSLANPGQAKTSCISQEEEAKRTSLENTIQNLESKEVQEAKRPVCENTRQSNEDSKDQGRDTIEENDNNLQVTAITIVTSIKDLIAKTTANESENDPPVDDIKKEIEIEEEELDNSSLKLADNAPRVTAITIMTSDAELFSLGQEDHKEVSEIKNETDVYYDAEDNLVNDIERVFENVNFGNNIMSERIERIEKNRVDSKEVSSKTPLAQNNRPEDEETIESIVKYVASMY